jgi:hypothetical protein
MSSILSRDAESGSTKRTDDGGRDPVVRAFRTMADDEERTAAGRDTGIARTFLLVDLGAAMNYLRGRRGSSEAAEALTEMVSEPGSTSGLELQSESDGRGGGGRGTLSKLFLVGMVVGLGYVLRQRSGSVGQTVSQATERARSVADRTERRSGEMAGRTEAATEKAADRIEETGETVADQAADRVRESGEMAADRVQESGEMAADEIEGAAEKTEEAEEQAEEKADEVGSENEESQA